jgi:hypothetical protein
LKEARQPASFWQGGVGESAKWNGNSKEGPKEKHEKSNVKASKRPDDHGDVILHQDEADRTALSVRWAWTKGRTSGITKQKMSGMNR